MENEGAYHNLWNMAEWGKWTSGEVATADEIIQEAKRTGLAFESVLRVCRMSPLFKGYSDEEIQEWFEFEEDSEEELQFREEEAELGRINFDDISDEDLISEWIVPGFILAGGEQYELYSASPKDGKSLLMLWICQRFVRGLPQFTEVQGDDEQLESGSIVYLDMENRKEHVLGRLLKMGVDRSELRKHFHYYSFPRFAGKLNTEEGAQDFLGYVDRIEPTPALVVIDTTTRFVEGDQDKAGTIDKLYDYTQAELKERGISAIRLHQAGKNLARGPIGASARRADVDTIWRFVVDKVYDKNNHHVDFILSHGGLDRSGLHTPDINVSRLTNPLRHELTPAKVVAEKTSEADPYVAHRKVLIGAGCPGREIARATLQEHNLTIGSGALRDLIKELKSGPQDDS